MSPKSSHKAKSDRILNCVKGYIYLTATALGLIGLFLLFTVWATRNNNDWWLGWHDPLLGINNRAMLILGAILHLGVSAYLFAARDLTNRSLAVLWTGLNHLIYYVGVLLMEPSALPNTERFIGWRLRLQPAAVDTQWKFFQAYLAVTSSLILFLLWRHSKRLRKETWLKNWLDTRTGQPKEKPVVWKKPVTADDYTKNVCSHCGHKIAFPLSRVGECIACPHCAATIKLREPPAQMV